MVSSPRPNVEDKNSIEHAPKACYSCRHRKRRCDRRLPTCYLCDRKGLACVYATHPPQPPTQAPSQSQVASRSPQHNTPPDHTNQHNLYSRQVSWPTLSSSHDGSPTLFDQPYSIASSPEFGASAAIKFLAPQLFRNTGLGGLRSDQNIPGDVAYHLGDKQQMRETATTFFKLTRSWMPIVCPTHYLPAILNFESPCRRAFYLLALCMKLFCLPAPQLERDTAERYSLYRVAKRFYHEIESTEGLSIRIVQAGIIISIFEIGDAIYPSAYLSIGSCAQYGLAMGLNRTMKRRMGDNIDVSSWLEVEEFRRAWWAILILDRFLNLSDPSRPLVTEGPAFEDFLPVDDASYFDCTTTPKDATPISEAFSGTVGAFARLSQATYLISQALNVVRSRRTIEQGSDSYEASPEISHLCRTLGALVRANEHEVSIRRLGYCSQSVFSYSGILMLQQQFWDEVGVNSTEQAQQRTFEETYVALDTLDRIIKSIQEDEGRYKDECTVFLADVSYRAIIALITIGQGNPTADINAQVNRLKWLLRHIQCRLPLASIYISIADMKDAILAAKIL